MRITNIQITEWRHFQGVEVAPGLDAPLVCIVGANGTGKSHLLELIAACAHKLGLSHGLEAPRGDPFGDQHDFSLHFVLAPGASRAVEEELAKDQRAASWDRGLKFTSKRTTQHGHQLTIEATGIDDVSLRRSFADRIVTCLRNATDVHFVSLDADRAYPRKAYNANEVAQAYDIDWAHTDYTRGRSYKTTITLYEEWIKFFLAQENQAGTRLIKGIRRARLANDADPVFDDHFAGYRAALAKVLPHVIFTGVDSRARTLVFDTTGIELSFNQLSGGEREIAFLIGQIDRFRLRHGLFLLDEPELHLNADLIRTWIGFLTSTIETGQVWLATHSLEAVEAAGQRATFVLERDEDTRKVNSLARLDTRPILSALSRAVGSPAFSISQLAFAFVEGEEGVGERERFRNLSNFPSNIRFLEVGSCQEVFRRVSAVRSLADVAGTPIRIGGVIDRDFRSAADAARLANEHGVFVLEVHEVENFFLHPATVDALLAQNGRGTLRALDLIRDAADKRAGSWMFQWSMNTNPGKALPAIPTALKDRMKTLTWADIQADLEGVVRDLVALTAFPSDHSAQFDGIIRLAVKCYEKKREDSGLWRECEGKQILGYVSTALGYTGPSVMTQAAFAAWQRTPTLLSPELESLRLYLQKL